MQKSEREKQMLYEWGINHHRDIFMQMDNVKESYFQQRTSNSYIKEYSFETLSELMEELNALWGNGEEMESIKKVVGVAAMKNKPVKIENKEEQVETQLKQEEKLPTFIYNF